MYSVATEINFQSKFPSNVNSELRHSSSRRHADSEFAVTIDIQRPRLKFRESN